MPSTTAPAALLTLYDREIRRDARPDGPDDVVERVGRVVRRTAPAHGWNGVVWSDFASGEEADEAIADQIAHYTSLGLAFEWKLYAHDEPADLGSRLLAHGFTPEPDETLMAAEADALALTTTVPDGIRVVPVTDEAGVDQVAAVHERAFGDDASRLRRRLLDTLTTTPDTVAAVLALAGDVPVSAARMELSPGTSFAGLWGGGTVPEWRGRGIYRALVTHRARIAAARGYRVLHVDAGPQSRPILQRLGFTPLTVTTPYVYEPARSAHLEAHESRPPTAHENGGRPTRPDNHRSRTGPSPAPQRFSLARSRAATPTAARAIWISHSTQSTPLVSATPRADARAEPMRAAAMPTRIVHRTPMCWRPGTTRRPRTPITMPMTRALMMPSISMSSLPFLR